MDSNFDLEERLTANRPRRHHYEFAHTALKLIAFGGLSLMRQHLEGEDAVGRLWRLWDVVGRKLPDDQRLSASGLALKRFAIGDSDLFAVQLPQARRITEAHFVGIAFNRESGAMRYFTLEKGMSAAGEGEEEKTALCEWTSDASGLSHLNFGEGPAGPPDAECFASAVAPLMGERPESAHSAAVPSIERSLLSRN